MKDWKNILVKILWSIAGIALIVLFTYAWQDKSQKKCTGVQIELVGDNTSSLFMDELEIKALLAEQGVKQGVPIIELNLVKIEQSLANIKWIKNAEIFIDNKQEVQVRIEQRIPVARIFTATGGSFFIDSTAKQLPLKQLTVMRLPVITGFPSDQEKLSKPDSALLSHVLKLAMLIRKDSFFSAQVAQVNITSSGDLEIIPALGDHLVLIGSIENIEDKLNRLYTFYKKVWIQSGINAYQVLDCRFDHQIVALKKGMQPIYFAPGVLPFANFNGDTLAIQMPDTSALKMATVTTVELKEPDTLLVAKQAIRVKPLKPIVAVKKGATPKNKMKSKTTQKVVKGSSKKTIIKKNNKANNKTLNKVKKTAKAILPKKPASKKTN
jgi:cell division protein FtsQ